MNPPKIGGSRVHPEFRDPPPLFGVSGYLVRPKNSGVPLMDGVPILYSEDPPNSGVPCAPQNSGTPSLFLGCPGPTRTPPKFRGPPLIYGLPGYLGLP